MNAEIDHQTPSKHEDFPIRSLQYVEGKLSRIRRTLMDIAARIAEQSATNGESYRVEPLHVDQALTKLFHEFPAFRNDIGLVE